MDWRPSTAMGVEIGEFICSGYIYSANLGWIDVGRGLPRDGIQYRNDSVRDFGVNLDSAGNLRGMAYSANAGWIAFDPAGSPRLDLRTGMFSGFAYGANIGWMELGQSQATLAVESVSAGADTDGDGIPDGWELFYFGDLSVAGADRDFDQDGQTDWEEYAADTDPADPGDRFEILGLSRNDEQPSATVTWRSKPTRQYQLEVRPSLGTSSSWTDSGLGRQNADGLQTSRTIASDEPIRFFRIRAIRPLSAHEAP